MGLSFRSEREIPVMWTAPNRRAALAEHAAGGRTRSPSGVLRSARDLHIIFQLFEIYNLVGAYLGRPISSGKCRIQTRLGQYRPVLPTFYTAILSSGAGHAVRARRILEAQALALS